MKQYKARFSKIINKTISEITCCISDAIIHTNKLSSLSTLFRRLHQHGFLIRAQNKLFSQDEMIQDCILENHNKTKSKITCSLSDAIVHTNKLFLAINNVQKIEPTWTWMPDKATFSKSINKFLYTLMNTLKLLFGITLLVKTVHNIASGL